jgi:hypothetical protein
MPPACAGRGGAIARKATSKTGSPVVDAKSA